MNQKSVMEISKIRAKRAEKILKLIQLFLEGELEENSKIGSNFDHLVLSTLENLSRKVQKLKV